MRVLEWMGEHPVLTVLLAWAASEAVIGVAEAVSR
jgi:hypothetical protein